VGLGGCPGEKSESTWRFSISFSTNKKMISTRMMKSLRDPDREIGETVTQLVDQEGAVGVTKPVDRPRFRQDARR